MVLLILALGLGVACGDDDDDDDDVTSSPSAGTTTAGESSGDTIRLGFSAWPGWFPWQVAEEAGIFDDVGIDVEMVWFEGYLDSINAFAAGQLDGNSQTLNDTLASISAGSDQVVVLVNDNSTGNDQIIATADIQRIEDLAGKQIGVEVGVVDHFLLLLGLESVGLSEDDVNIVNLETGAAAASFAAGQLDAVGVFAPFTTRALEREGAHALFTSADFPGSIPDHLVLSRELVESRPDDVQKLVEAWFRTLEYIEENPDEALEIMAERAGVSVEDYRSYEEGTTIFSAEQNLEAFAPGDDFTSLQFAAEEIADFLVASGLAEERPETDGIFEPRFVEAYVEGNAGAE
ncbi:MAG TPA: ABC transporter substrate-binding protein [Dehalococcoidia bacterium]|nr:ABC transporter substrate-binding protein [Dehalococcoidia bacterium]